VIDTGNAQYDAWSPKVSMDNNGDAVVVWQEHDGTAQRVYARRYTAASGTWGAFQQLNDSGDFGTFDAGDPAIALSPTPGSAMAAWSQYNQKDWTITLDTSAPYDSVRSMAPYNGKLYAGMGSASDDGDIYVLDPATGSLTLFLDNTGPNEVDSMTVYNGILYVGYGGAAGAGNVASYDSVANTWTTVFQSGTPALNAGQYEAVRSMAVYNGQLYIGTGTSTGDADVYRCTICDGNDWTGVFGLPGNTTGDTGGVYEEVPAMAVYNNGTATQLYIGLGNTAGTDGDVYRCTLCDGTDWTLVLNNGAPYDAVRSMAVYNNQLYVGLGDESGDGDVMRCTTCNLGGADWATVFTDGGSTTYEGVGSMVSYNGFLYIGLGTGTAGDGDIKRCNVCSGADWIDSRADAGTYEAVFSLAVFNGELYAGFGSTANTDGDIWKFSAGWQTVARRMVNGVWDTTDTICPPGSGVNDGICYVSGVLGTAVQPTQSPRVKVDNAGRAIVAFVQMIQQSDCFVPPTAPLPPDNDVVIATANCMVSTLQANLYDGTSWQSPIDLHPDANLSSGTPGSVESVGQLICFEAGDDVAATRGQVSSSDSCVNLLEFDLTMDTTGRTFLLIKTSWGLSEDFGTAGVCAGGQHTVGVCSPDGNGFEVYMGQAIVAREYTMASPWSAASWTLNRLSNFGYEGGTGTNFGVALGPFPAGCPSTTTIDGGRVVLNCKFNHPRISIEPDGGGTAIAVYESYNGTTYNVNGQRFDGATWTGSTTIDAGGGDAHAPQIAMDNSGNGVAVWTQSDGAKVRIYSNCYAPAAGSGTCGNVGSTGWQGAILVDGDVMNESGYFSPLVDLAAPGGANSALSLFLGWFQPNNTTRLYSAMGP
jgi:hypothetical protein